MGRILYLVPYLLCGLTGGEPVILWGRGLSGLVNEKPTFDCLTLLSLPLFTFWLITVNGN